MTFKVDIVKLSAKNPVAEMLFDHFSKTLASQDFMYLNLTAGSSIFESQKCDSYVMAAFDDEHILTELWLNIEGQGNNAMVISELKEKLINRFQVEFL